MLLRTKIITYTEGSHEARRADEMRTSYPFPGPPASHSPCDQKHDVHEEMEESSNFQGKSPFHAAGICVSELTTIPLTQANAFMTSQSKDALSPVLCLLLFLFLPLILNTTKTFNQLDFMHVFSF